MATTFTQLEVKDREKVVIINENFDQVPRYLDELFADPVTTGVAPGSTYYNTVSLKLKFLNSSLVWVNTA